MKKKEKLSYEQLCELLKLNLKKRPDFEKEEELFQYSLHFLFNDKITYSEAMHQLGRLVFAKFTLLANSERWDDLYCKLLELMNDGRRSCSFNKNCDQESFRFEDINRYFKTYYKKDEFIEYKDYRDNGEFFKGFIAMARDFGNEDSVDEIVQFYLIMESNHFYLSSIEKDFNNALFTGELKEEDYEKWLNS